MKRKEDIQSFKEWISKSEEFYKLNSNDIRDLKACDEHIAKKFDIFERIMVEFNLNIEALKTHALSTDLHLESSLPI